MKELRYTRQLKKDLNQPKKFEELKIVLDMLRNEIYYCPLNHKKSSPTSCMA